MTESAWRLLARGLVAALILLSGVAWADEAPVFERRGDRPVALIADEILYDADEAVVTARGSVQVFYDGRTLTADEIVYDSAADRITATGAITLRTERGETVYADIADLDAELRDGLVRGARSVIQGGGKISAVEARRVDNRYNVLSKAVFSPCEVCAARPTPLWRIRARKIIHDQEEREIHYQDAMFDLFGVPIGYLPYFRHPSPEVKRATGFLPPTGGNDRAYGVYAKTPFYLVIDEQSDITLTPFLALGDGVLLEVEYRRLFERGFIELDLSGGVTNYGNDGRGARARFGGFGRGRYEAADGVHLGFDLEIAADDPFLRRYDYTEQDRLTSEVFARAYDGRSFASVSAAYLQSLRVGEPQDAIPFVVPVFEARHVMETPAIGGDLALNLSGQGLVRETGRDVGRVSFGAEWSRQVILSSGLALRGFAEARADYYEIGDDPAFDGDAFRLAPLAGIEARMPFSRVDEWGGLQILEPIASFVFAPEDIEDGDIPNEDSILAEFDHTNIFETDRQPGYDRFESGSRVTLGGRFQRIDPAGLGVQASAGRIFRFDDNADFTADSGLAGDASDYIVALSLTWRQDAEIYSSWRLSEEFGVNRVDLGGRVHVDPFTLYGAYIFVDEDPAAASPIDRSELVIGGALQLSRNWTLGADARHDFIADDFVTVGGVLSYTDECAGFDFFARRRFTESVSQPDGTSVGVRVRLFGAGGGDRSKASGACAYGG